MRHKWKGLRDGAADKRCAPQKCGAGKKRRVLVCASVASMISQFNMPNIRLLQSMGYEVHAACNFSEGNTCSRQEIQQLKKTLKNMHVVPHPWDCPRKLFPAYKWVRAYRQMCRLMADVPFAWIHCHSPAGGALARMAAHRMGIPAVYTAHGFHFYRGAPFINWLLYYPAEWLLARWTNVLITLNREDYRTAAGRMKAGKICCIPGAGLAKIQDTFSSRRTALRAQFQIPEDAVFLLSVGELSRRKNHQAVLAALAQMGRKDVYYLVCGQGPLEKSLTGYAEKLGIKDRFRLAGFQTEVQRFYEAADLFVFPSRQEGLPMALLEAMAFGLPCAVSDIRGNRELMKRQAGITQPGGAVFSLKKPGQMKAALELLLQNQAAWEACGKQNQETAKKYEWEAVEKRMKKIYGYMADRCRRRQTDA